MGNKRVWVPESSIRRRNKSIATMGAAMSPKPTPTDIIMEKSRNTRVQMTEQKYGQLTMDPENIAGHRALREKYSLP